MDKLKIAQEFIDNHKSFDIESNGGIENVYANLIGGTYGEIRIEEAFDGLELRIEIPSNESNTGNPVIFSWVDSDHIAEIME